MSMLDFLLAQTAPNAGLAQMGGQNPLAVNAAESPLLLKLLANSQGAPIAPVANVKQGATQSPLDFLLMNTAGKQPAAGNLVQQGTIPMKLSEIEQSPMITKMFEDQAAKRAAAAQAGYDTPALPALPQTAPAPAPAPTPVAQTAPTQAPVVAQTPAAAPVQAPPATPAPAAAPATPAAATPAANPSMMASLGNWFNDPANQRLLLGLGATLGRGGSAAEGFLTGAQMRDQYNANLANTQMAGQKQEADLALTKAQTGKATADAESARASARKALAEANKLAKEANLSKDELEGFRKTYNTNIGEMGGLGDPMASVEATALTAMQELAGSPDSKALQTLLDNSLTTLLNNVNGMEIDAAKAKLTQLQNTFGKAKVDAIAQTIMGG